MRKKEGKEDKKMKDKRISQPTVINRLYGYITEYSHPVFLTEIVFTKDNSSVKEIYNNTPSAISTTLMVCFALQTEQAYSNQNDPFTHYEL